MSSAIKKVCRKRVNESSHQLNPRGDAVLGSDDSVKESPVVSVESSSSMDSSGEDSIIPITPSSKCKGVDPFLGLDDSPSPLGVPNRELIDCDYKCKGGVLLKRVCDSQAPLALRKQELRGCDYNRKGGGFLKLECDSLSPFSSQNQQLLHCDSQSNDGGFFSEDYPCTPKKDLFDPFAPGPDKLNLAPYCRKYTEESKVSVVRELNFDLCAKLAASSEDLTVSEDEILFQSVYSDILEVIISNQNLEKGMVSCELPLSDECRTPIVTTRLSGVADTCPGAPARAKRPYKVRRINKKVCRKLDF